MLYPLILISLFLNFSCLLSSRFIYMGLDIAMEQHSWSHIGFIFFSIVSIPLSTVYFSCFSFLIPFSCGSLISSMWNSVIYWCCKVLLLIFLSYLSTLDHYIFTQICVFGDTISLFFLKRNFIFDVLSLCFTFRGSICVFDCSILCDNS